MTTATNIARTIDRLIDSDLSNTQDPFTMEARIYGTDPDGAYLLAEGQDPYELLFGLDRPAGLTGVALVATGWAAPIEGDNDLPPSERTDRVRVRVICAHNGLQWASVLRRQDSDDIDETDERGGGMLPDVIEAWWNQDDLF